MQMLQWTKTQQIDKRPKRLEELRKKLNLNVFQTLLEKNIVVARCFETQDPHTPQTYPFGLLQNMMKTVFIKSRRFPQLCNLHISFNPHIAATWRHENEVMAVRGRPGTFLTSRKRLSQFYDGDTVEQTKGHRFESLDAPLSPYINLKQYSVKDESSSGFIERRSFPYFHTLFIVDNQALPEIQLIQKGIIYAFGRLLVQAVERHGNGIIGTEIPEPECAQCIVTNGKRFSFIWYQLNTLNIESMNDNEVKNLVCIERPGMLYSKIDSVKGQRKKKVADVNQDILRTLLSMFLLA